MIKYYFHKFVRTIYIYKKKVITVLIFNSKSLKCKIRKRLVKISVPSTSSIIKKEDEVDSGTKVEAKPRPLKHMQFIIKGNT